MTDVTPAIPTQANEPLDASIEFAVTAPSEDFVTWLARQPHMTHARTLIICSPPERPVTELLQESLAIGMARYQALDTDVRAAIQDCDFGTVNRWLLESDLEALPEDLRAWIRADWIFEVQRLGAERAYVSARARAQVRHFDSLLASVFRVFDCKREFSAVAYPSDPNGADRPKHWQELLNAARPEPGPLLSNRLAPRPALAEPIPFDTPAAKQPAEPASAIGAEGEGEAWQKRALEAGYELPPAQLPEGLVHNGKPCPLHRWPGLLRVVQGYWDREPVHVTARAIPIGVRDVTRLRLTAASRRWIPPGEERNRIR